MVASPLLAGSSVVVEITVPLNPLVTVTIEFTERSEDALPDDAMLNDMDVGTSTTTVLGSPLFAGGNVVVEVTVPA